jgi:hypothetical protein
MEACGREAMVVCGGQRTVEGRRVVVCVWVVGIWLGIKRAKTGEGGCERNERLRVGGPSGEPN